MILAKALHADPEHVDVDTPLLEIGASSLVLVDVIRTIQDKYGVRPSTRRVFGEFQSTRLLADYILELMDKRKARSAARHDPPPAAGTDQERKADIETGPLPLTAMQKQQWFLTQFSRGASLSHQDTVVLGLRGALDRGALAEAWRTVSQRHGSLRSVILADGTQQTSSEATVPLDTVDLTRHAATERKAAVARWLTDNARQPFDIGKALIRASVLELHEREHLLAVTAHHLAADRRAIHALLEEVAAIYRARSGASIPALPPSASYHHYVQRMTPEARREQDESARQFWRERLSGTLPVLDLPTDNPRPPTQSYRGARLVVPLDDQLVARLRAWTQAHRSTLSAGVLAGLSVLLHRLTGDRDIILGLGCQTDPTLPAGQALIVNTSNVAPLRLEIDPQRTFEELFETTRSALLDVFDQRAFPFADLVELIDPDRDQSRPPLFSVAFDAETPAVPQFPGLDTTPITPPISHTRYDLECTLVQRGDRAKLICDYSTDLFGPETIRRWMNHLRVMLAHVVERPHDALHRIPLLTADDQRQLLAASAGPVVHSPESLVHQRFEAQAARSPESVALVGEGTEITYGALNARANQLAHRLRRLGVERGTVVGVAMERSADMVLSLIAIFKAGGIYAPLDPQHPRERLAGIVDQLHTPVLLTQSRWKESLPTSPATVICVDEQRSELDQEVSEDLASGVTADDPAFLLFTSGSTGVPKGVVGLHRTLANRCAHEPRPIGAQEIFAHKTAPGFIDSFWEIFAPLTRGLRVVVISSEDANEPDRLIRTLGAHGVTRLVLVPSLLRMLLDAAPDLQAKLPQLVHWACSGEALPVNLCRRFHQRMPRASLINIYGLSETWDALWYDTQRGVPDSSVPLGHPLTNVKVYLLDASMSPVPTGVTAEIYVAGPGVAQGYWNRPDLTGEQFVANPLAADSSERLYKTGDLARRLPNGEIEMVGRADQQVKIRGYRVELDEVEIALERHPNVVTAAALAVKEAPTGAAALVGYLVPRQKPAPTVSELRRFLATTLPQYMIPNSFIMLDELPLTPSGKKDRKSLPRPESVERVELGTAYVAPSTPIEQDLASMWSSQLKHERIGIYDNFFDLGGTSILITAQMLKVRERYDVGISLRQFFDEPTIAGVAKIIQDGQRAQQEKYTERPQHDPLGGPAAVARFEFLKSEAQLDPQLHPAADIQAPSTTVSRLFLTGATGFVGAYLLRELLDRGSQEIHCLVRADSVEHAKERMVKNMKRWGVWKEGLAERLFPVLGDLTKHQLGLSDQAFGELGQTMDSIIHSGAMVQFLYPYQVLKPINVTGTQEIIRLAMAQKLKPIHYISTAAVFPMGAHRTFSEDSSIEQDLFLNLAYDETKWVAEQLLKQAEERGLPVTIYRMGEICGHSETGQSVTEHSVYAFMKGCIQLKTFPYIEMLFDIAPVDYIAKSVAHITLHPESADGNVFHLNNPTPIPILDMYKWFRDVGYEFEVIEWTQWRDRLVSHDKLTQNALYPFVGLVEDFTVLNSEFPRYDSRRTQKSLEGSGITCHPVDATLLGRVFGFLMDVGYFPKPQNPGIPMRP
ncbi:MAG: amino acid adenylation domain-containing protein [Myxococcota bacterium]